MFRKPFTVRRNTNIKNSERRRILKQLPCSEGIPNKATAALVKIRCHNDETVSCYAFDKEPLLFAADSDQILCPTVYLMWKVQEAFPVLYIRENVFGFLQNGADLMLPGIVRPDGSFPDFDRHTPVALTIVTPSKYIGPVAVGITLLSSMEMLANGMQGRGVRMVHLFGDFLWEMGSRSQPPEIEKDIPSVNNNLAVEDFPPLESFQSLSVGSKEKDESPKQDLDDESAVPIASSGIPQLSDSLDAVKDSVVEAVPAESMEILLERCFLAALKHRVTKKTQLPLDIGEFYAHYLLPCVPSACRLDMKKTKYKKFSTFLVDINANEHGPILKVAQKQKGSEMIVEINWSHPYLKDFKITNEQTAESKEETKDMVKVEEVYTVTEPTVPLFRMEGYTKGSCLTLQRVREILTCYVKKMGMDSGNKIRLNDEVLKVLLKSDETIDWNTLFQKVTARMTKTFIITGVDGRQMVRKVGLPKITFKIENRSGNKKVTLINNLALYGFDCKAFCQQVQIGVAASATLVTSAPLCEGPQVLVSGNQIAFVSDMLQTKYRVDKKYMQGTELAVSKKK